MSLPGKVRDDMARFPIPPNRLPALDSLLNGPLWRQWSDRGWVFPLDDLRAAVRYVRLKPTTSCRLAIFGGPPAGPTDPPAGFVVHLYPDAERARLAFEKIASRERRIETGGYPAFCCDRYPVVAVPFPHDVELRPLRHVHDRFRLKQALTEILTEFPPEAWRISKRGTDLTLLAYKPGRRAVYRVDVEIHHRRRTETIRLTLHVKVEQEQTRERSFRNLVAIHDAVPRGADWKVPAPRGEARERSFVAAEWIDGESLLALVQRPQEAIPAFRAAGRALAGMHALSVKLDPYRPEEESRGLIRLADDLAQLLPEDRGRILDLGQRLAEAPGQPAAGSMSTIHGDFHLGQVLHRQGSPVIVDLDRAGLGPAELDVGSFCAHLIELRADPELGRAFLDGYSSSSERPLQPEILTLTTAASLFRRAVFPFRSLDTAWPAETTRRLEQIDGLLRGNGPLP